MKDLWRTRSAVVDMDNLADQATYRRLLKGFRREEEEYHRNHLQSPRKGPGEDPAQLTGIASRLHAIFARASIAKSST